MDNIEKELSDLIKIECKHEDSVQKHVMDFTYWKCNTCGRESKNPLPEPPKESLNGNLK